METAQLPSSSFDWQLFVDSFSVTLTQVSAANLDNLVFNPQTGSFVPAAQAGSVSGPQFSFNPQTGNFVQVGGGGVGVGGGGVGVGGGNRPQFGAPSPAFNQINAAGFGQQRPPNQQVGDVQMPHLNQSASGQNTIQLP